MLDLTRTSDIAGDFQDQSAGDTNPDSLLTQLAIGGIDLAQLEGLGSPEIAEFLELYGVDVASLDSRQITNLVDQLSDGSSIQSVSDLLATLSDRN